MEDHLMASGQGRFSLLRFAKLLSLLIASATAFAGCRTAAPLATTQEPVMKANAPIPQATQFDVKEAMTMIEFCVDLDNQDDRMTPGYRHIDDMRSDRCVGWTKVKDSRDLVAKHFKLDAANGANPAKNGFVPFDSAWTLWKNANSAQPEYALAFRGTVFSATPSAAEDAIVTTIAGQHGIEYPSHKYLPITFATLPRAEVHEGFAYATFSELFDNDFGALKHLKDIEPGATLIITGHSQGAALATLAHAFLYYSAQEGRFGIKEKNLKLRSYVFAQPKPGNAQFAMDFAQITGGGANSFVFNNSLDPVPMLPPTHLFFAEAFQDVRTTGFGFAVYRFLNNALNSIKRTIPGIVSHRLASQIKTLQKHEHDRFYLWSELSANSTQKTIGGTSQSYTTAGQLIPLCGLNHGRDYYGNSADEDDSFVQHHATSYRRLLESAYAYPATTEQNAK